MSESGRAPKVPQAHGLAPLRGRDPQEADRSGSPLELIFDLVAVVAISIASSQFATLLEESHWALGIFAFCFAVWCIAWAWLNFSRLLSAFDTDDWAIRLVTLQQMVGVLVIALGIEPMVASVDHGGRLGDQMIVVGYCIMRTGSLLLWLRVARSAPRYRRLALRNTLTLTVSQAAWLLQAFLPLPVAVAYVFLGLCMALEVILPALAERHQLLPWNPGHMSERLSAFVIITLGEVVLGTLTTVQASLTEHGWTVDGIALAVAGLALAFGVWWIYFIVPTGQILAVRPRLIFPVGYLHIALYACIAATGAGLSSAASFIDAGPGTGTPTTGAGHGAPLLPVALVIATTTMGALVLVFVIYDVMVRGWEVFHLFLVLATAAVGAAGVILAARGVSLGAVLLVLMLMPWVSVLGYELRGYRTGGDRIERTVRDG